MKLKIIVLVLFICLVSKVSAQSARKLAFQAHYGGKELVLDKYYRLNAGDSVQFTAFRFYISNLQLLKQGKVVWKETGSFHLIDIQDAESCRLTELPADISYDQVRFDLGIDSTTNVSGAMGGDLDPMFGMYWSWQSGYINLKLEGESNLCATRNHAFEFHLGGYDRAHNALQTVTLDLAADKNTILVADLGKWLQAIDLAKENQIMSPGVKAVEMMKAVAGVFRME